MADDLRVRNLVEEILESKRTPEDVCADAPDLLPAVRRRLAQVQRLGDQLDEMFGDDESTRHGDAAVLRSEIELPVLSEYKVAAVLGRGGMGIERLVIVTKSPSRSCQ
jgi:serine/threonine-protein kinase